MKTIEIRSLFDHWNAAIQTGKADNVVELYDTNAILLPTISNKVRKTHAEIEDYFVAFLAKGPIGRIDDSNVRIYGDIAINSGIYTFTFANGSSVQARFSFVYRFNGHGYKIVEHHSSAMPE